MIQYTTINSLQIIGPYLFVLKTRSAEIHPLPQGFLPESCGSSALPIARHQFRTYNFRAFYLTDIETLEESYVVKFLASDVIQGLFFFRATINIPSDGHNDPSLIVETLCVYPMAAGIPVRQPEVRSGETTYGADAGSQERLALNTGHVRSPFFVSACSLGPQGKRGIWVERRRGVMDKNIVACRFTPETSQRNDIESDDSDIPVLLTGQVVHTLRSYDLNGECFLLAARHSSDL